jgi:hypothetical protein
MTEPDRQAAVKEVRRRGAHASALVAKDAKQGQLLDFHRTTPVQGRCGSKDGRAVLSLPCSNPQHAIATTDPGGFRLGHKHKIGGTFCGAGGQQVRASAVVAVVVVVACRMCLLFPL